MQGSRQGVVPAVALLVVSVLVGAVLIIEPWVSTATIGSEALGAGPVPGAGPVSIHLDPDSGAAGSGLSVSGAGFAGGEEVGLFFGGHRIGSTTADAAGGFFDVPVTLPDSASTVVGPYVVAVGVESDRSSMALVTLE